jgi:hypothetical protein
VTPTPRPAPLLAGIYAAGKADRLVRVAEPARRVGWEIAFWGLEEIDGRLAGVTRGSGRGLRLENLNRVLGPALEEPRWVVLCDDDVEFVRGDVVRLVAECEAAGFGLAQPAHAPGSHVSHHHTRAVPRSRAREVTFIECGPISVVSPSWCRRVLPLPEWRGMGWGLELEWMDLRAQGCVLGIVDAVTYRHLDAVGRTYNESVERERMRADLEARGIEDLSLWQSTLRTWRPWRRRPPWRGREAAR